MSQHSVQKKKRSKTDPPLQCGPPGWVDSDAKLTHLRGKIPAFRSAQANGTLKGFWPGMQTQFNAGFPTPQLTPGEIAEGIKMEDKILRELRVSSVTQYKPQEGELTAN